MLILISEGHFVPFWPFPPGLLKSGSYWGLSDIARVIERTVVKVTSMLRVSINQVLKLIFSFTDMSGFSCTESN